MNENYWLRKRRLSRRRALQAGAGLTAGTAGIALVGCGDDDDDDDDDNGGADPTATSSSGNGEPTSSAEPTTATDPGAPVKGGDWVAPITAFPSTLDPYTTSETPVRSSWAGHVYSKLIQQLGVPTGPQYPSQEVVPDLAETWETPDEGLTYTFKINPKAKWHPPLDRPVVAEDIVFAFSRFSGTSGVATPAVNTEQLGMVDSVEAVDDSTVVFHLNEVNALFLLRLADDYVFPIMPPEIESTIDVTNEGVGSGAWIVDEINRPISIKYRRNPDWHLGPDLPYLDTWEFIVADAATSINQYKARNFDTVAAGAKDVPGIMDAIDDLQVALGPSGTAMPYVAFSAVDQSAPWLADPRIRQALSMSIDRDSLWQAFYPDRFYTDVGLPIPPVQWHNLVPTGLGPEWLDPQGDRINPEYKSFFEYNPEAARALLEEAGHEDGIEGKLHYTVGYGPDFATHAELLQQMVGDGGFDMTLEVDDFSSVFIPRTFLQGDFDGFAQIYQGYGTAIEWLNGMYIPGASRNQGRIDDPDLTAQIMAVNGELDLEARGEQVADIVNYIDSQMYYVPGILGAGPAIRFWRPDVHGTEDHITARSGSGFWAAYNWKDA